MQKDWVSIVNLWFQQNSSIVPKYAFSRDNDLWVATTECLGEKHCGHATSKKEAKQNAAEQVYQRITEQYQQEIRLSDPLLILVDGDQRADCWKWLANIEWPDKLSVRVYASPITPIIDCKRITVITTASASRDAADAKILMDLGALLVQNPSKLLIVSSDHILVQAAQDTAGVEWVGNLAQLKEFLGIAVKN